MNQIRELRLHAEALVRSIEQDRKFFASIAHYAERLNWIVAEGIDELTQDEIGILAHRIKDFFSKWRSSDAGLYAVPREVIDANPTVQEINRIAGSLTALDPGEFQELAQNEARAMPPISVPDATDRPGDVTRSYVLIVERICDRFHLVARQLRSRHDNRETLDVEDEYDVQDLLHALLTLEFDDIRPEEWTPSYAGSGSRVDFLLKQEQIVIEAKKTRKGLGAKEIGEQLIVDIQRYQSHPDCRTLICFVYDPDGRIANPRGIENDLNREHNGLGVEVIIAPKGL
jgi:hypothetical protein